ncbi:hypothetical protein BJY18_002029 [Amycolatopsis jiangsuensis]|uniref:Uncharacterized protein n=1 Tax=Amycolatopsis jiangsuensis TaxID=1181879 RepID=A0A840IR71_9PSEU|nr:hypothetical protein [Amycolatopsis jiangsuensis]MBB4684544.1 hypothetical protein [Amycolatopsis jiangsuensis]
MSEPADATSGHDVPPSFADELRRRAAAFRACAETEGRAAGLFAGLDERGLPGMADMRSRSERAVRMLTQVASVNAAQALAYDEMIAAGGPDDARAYVEYEATTRRLLALMPADTLAD